MNVTNYGGIPLQVVGSCTIRCIIRGSDHLINFVIVQTSCNAVPLLGIEV